MANDLSHLGFSTSYEQITSYKYSAIASEEEGVENLLDVKFTQWIGDNIDHNIQTIDGKNTFHGMGIIAVGTTARKQEPSECLRSLRLRSKLIRTELKNLQITFYEPDEQRGCLKSLLNLRCNLYNLYCSGYYGVIIFRSRPCYLVKKRTTQA